MPYAEIGARIKSRRKELGISAAELASRLSLSKSTIHRYENGDIANIKMPVAEKMAKELRVNILWLLGKSDIKADPSIVPDISDALDELIDMARNAEVFVVRGQEAEEFEKRLVMSALLMARMYMDSFDR